MDRPYATYSRTSTTARNAGATGTRDRRRGGFTDVETDIETNIVDGGATYRRRAESGYGYGYGSSTGYDYRTGSDYDRSDDVRDYDSYDGDDDDIYEYEDPIDRRWIWVAGVAAAILLIAVICTVVILGGGDSGPVSKTIAATTPATTAQDAVTSPITKAPLIVTSAAPPPAAAAPLSPETVTTVSPSPTAVAPVPAQAAPVPAASPRTVTYQVTGTRPLLDLVTVVYTDGQGALQTQFNVALPWVRSVTLDPGVELTSITATSLTGQLNCSVTDSTGATLVAQNTNSMIATCTR